MDRSEIETIASEDAHLVRRLREGDPEAGDRFVRDHYPAVRHYLTYLTGDAHRAEDLTQETFVKAWRGLGQFRGQSSLRLWLHRIARREFLLDVRRRRPQVALEQVAEVAAAPCGVEWVDAIALREAVGTLPGEEGEVVLLHYWHGYDCREIGQIVRVPVGTVKYRLAMARARLRQALGDDDLTELNGAPLPGRLGSGVSIEGLRAIEEATMRPDKLSRREFIGTAAGAGALAITGAGASSGAVDNATDVVDGRLSRKVTPAFKATALTDILAHLTAETGVALTAGASVADEKVTLFCKATPLRDVMRQLARPFGYTWVRGGETGKHRYELLQDLRSQLLEEELRDRDRDAALLALDREMQRYRPFLDLSPKEAETRAKSASEADQPLLENLSRHGWGPIQIYFRLSARDLSAMRDGQTVIFSQLPRPGERELPADIAHGALLGVRNWRVHPGVNDGDLLGLYAQEEAATKLPDLPPPDALPEMRVRIDLSIQQMELGRFAFRGGLGLFTVSERFRNFDIAGPDGPWMTGVSPAVARPDNAAKNARLASRPPMRAPVSIQPPPSCRLEPFPGGLHYPRGLYGEQPANRAGGPRITSADVLEALHRATGVPIVADYYTRLYEPETVSVRDTPLFDALNQLCDRMRLRWDRDTSGGWLRFRSAGFYHDRLKEVPNRLLTGWSAARREHGRLRLDDLIEIANLSETQLDATEMAEGARACFGLVEWELGRHPVLRPQLRDLALFTPAQREEAMSPTGLAVTRMSLAQQQRFLAHALDPKGPPLQSFDELAGATLWIDYSQPGAFEWTVGYPGPWQTWLMPVAPGPDGAGRRALRPRARGRTREEALQAYGRLDPAIVTTLRESYRRDTPEYLPGPPTDRAKEIWPTGLGLLFLYIPGSSHRRVIRIFSAGLVSVQSTS